MLTPEIGDTSTILLDAKAATMSRDSGRLIRTDCVVRLLEGLQCRRVLLVVDANAFRPSGAEALMSQWLDRLNVAQFSDFTPNPKDDEVDRCVAKCRAFQPELVIAIGGGSTIDVAKLARACDQPGYQARDVIQARADVNAHGPPLLAIPTTAGTGSEATHFSAVYVDGRKYSLAHRSMRPEYFVLDEALTESLPPEIAIQTGLDALCQSIESMWSVKSTARSREYSARSLLLVWNAIHRCATSPTRRNRRAMLVGAHLAGRAINIAQTTACHAMSYVLTSKFGVPHGRAVALMLLPVWDFNRNVTNESLCDSRGVDHVKQTIQRLSQLIGASDSNQAVELIRAKLTSLGAATCLAEADLPGEAIELVAAEIDPVRIANNPRKLTPEDARAMLG